MVSIYSKIYRKNKTTNNKFFPLIRLYSGLGTNIQIIERNDIEHALSLKMIRGRDASFGEIYRYIKMLASWFQDMHVKEYELIDRKFDNLWGNDCRPNIFDQSVYALDLDPPIYNRSLLISAIRKHDYDIAEILIREGIRGNISFDQVDSLGNDALMSAVFEGYLRLQRKITKMLIDAYDRTNTILNRQNILGNTALIMAPMGKGIFKIINHDVNISILIEAHIKSNQSIEIQNNAGDNALMVSTRSRACKMFDVLLKAFVACGCSLDTINKKNETALIMALKADELDHAALLVRAGCSIDCLKNVDNFYMAPGPVYQHFLRSIDKSIHYNEPDGLMGTVKHKDLYNRLIKKSNNDVRMSDFYAQPKEHQV